VVGKSDEEKRGVRVGSSSILDFEQCIEQVSG